MIEKLTTYKGFDADMRCREFQYAIGGIYEHNGPVKACESGFHACEYPLDVFAYYAPSGSKFAVVEQSGDLSKHDDDSKVASSKISVKASIDIPGLIKAAIEYTIARCTPIDPLSPAFSDQDQGIASATGDRSASSATGYSSASSATGDSSASSATGYRSASSATGNRSASSATGNSSASSATGNSSASSATGYRSASSATGDSSASSATGYRSASSATGDSSASSATGYRSASSATGYSSASSATGYSAASLSTGLYSSSEIVPSANGNQLHAVAIGTGYANKVRAPLGSAIVCVYRNDDGELVHIRAAKVGDDGIKPDTWYSLDANGEFVEAQS